MNNLERIESIVIPDNRLNNKLMDLHETLPQTISNKIESYNYSEKKTMITNP